MKPSSSTQSFRSDESNLSQANQSPETSGKELGATKKEVTSKIASLWKRVEDSKSKATNKDNGNKVWMSKGKPIHTEKIEGNKNQNQVSTIYFTIQMSQYRRIFGWP